MKSVFFIAEQDTLLGTLLNLRNPNALIDFSKPTRFSMPAPKELPYVSEYLIDFDDTVEALRRFIGNELYKGFMRIDFLVALPDDCTDIETRAINEMMLCCGAKGCTTEYQAFLLSSDPEYLAITMSKRSVIVTHVREDSEDTEQIFIDRNDDLPERISEACQMLDEEGGLPVYTYRLPAELQIGTAVKPDVLIRNFVRLQ